MPAKLNHTIAAARDRNASATFLSEVLGLDPPLVLGSLAVVRVASLLARHSAATRAENFR